MRRLPVYLVLDLSASMAGEPIEVMRSGVQMLVGGLRKDLHALETAYVSVVTSESVAKQVVPLTDLISFSEPKFEAGGATSLGAALKLLCDKLESEVKKTTADDKGDWRPLVFLMTDGGPTDSWQKAAAELRKRPATVVACAAGFQADTAVLKQITEIVLQLASTSKADLEKFFQWVTASVTAGSQKVQTGADDSGQLGDLPPPPPEIRVVA